jgi:ubiquinone/menaquinone biosynthesis C-methylase UbiE
MNFQKEPTRIVKFMQLIKQYNPKNVLDVGCGIGTLVKELNKNKIDAFGIDFSADLKSFWNDNYHFSVSDANKTPYEDGHFDIVFSSDFFEHLNEEDIDGVANEMKRIGKRVIAFVADDLGKRLNHRQTMYHCTHKPIKWWIDKLQGIDVHTSHI